MNAAVALEKLALPIHDARSPTHSSCTRALYGGPRTLRAGFPENLLGLAIRYTDTLKHGPSSRSDLGPFGLPRPPLNHCESGVSWFRPPLAKSWPTSL